jgi:hypothetical protein
MKETADDLFYVSIINVFLVTFYLILKETSKLRYCAKILFGNQQQS